MVFDKIIPTKNKSKWVNTCEYIILHHTGGGWYDGNVKVLSWQTERQVSVHYLVAQDGRVAKIGEDTDILRHCGVSEREGKTDMNRYGIGIEIVNVDTNFTDIQRQAVRNLVAFLLAKHSIPTNRIIRHKDIAPKRKVDVYDTFWNNQFKTFQDYQNSYATKKEWQDYLRSLIAANGKEWGASKDTAYKDLLNDINNLCREYFGEPKK